MPRGRAPRGRVEAVSPDWCPPSHTVGLGTEGFQLREGGGGGWHKASVSIVCPWRRLLASRHCSF